MNGRTIIVTGGAGYLGRCAVEVLRERGFRPFVVDNFSASHRESLEGVDFAEADLCDLAKSREAFRKAGSAHAVIHFAALALVEESVRQPERYLKNNVGAAETVARLCGELGIGRLIHSSSCA
ncbi:MAG: NAD-dependent epimerase/dehydratase family protein, partial [Deltaproteobacteria bacterium]|nr:NAD-dependent epimerase/dehydratase family protein [Deltaproteobacteria bacterium]